MGFNPMRDKSFRDRPTSPSARCVGAVIDDMTARRFGEDTQRDYRPAREELHGAFSAVRRIPLRVRTFVDINCIWPSSRSVRGASTRRALRCGSSSRSRSNGPTSSGIWRPYSGRAAAPVVLSEEEVARLLRSAPSLKYKAALCVAYGATRPAGVRGREPQGIRYRRRAHGGLRVEQGGKGAARPLRDAFATAARSCCANGGARRGRRPITPGQNPVSPMSARQLVRAVHAAAQAAGIAKRVSPHTLRHGFRDPSARAERRHSGDPSPARTRQARDDRALHPGRRQHDPRRQEPVGAAGRQPRERVTPAGLTKPRKRRWPRLEVADVFWAHGAAWHKANAGHVSHAQLKGDVGGRDLSNRRARRTCRALRRRTARTNASPTNSCTAIATCPKCQGAACAAQCSSKNAEGPELLPVPYYHVVFTLPAAIEAIAFQNKAAVYDLLFRIAAETLITIAADPKLSGRAASASPPSSTPGSSALTHHPHVHVIVPGGGRNVAGRIRRWIACKPGFFLPVRVLSAPVPPPLSRRARSAAQGQPPRLLRRPRPARATNAPSTPLSRRCAAQNGVVYAKRPFAGPQAVLAYLSRYTHRVAISNSRLTALVDEAGVTFKWKDYRISKAATGSRTMTLDAAEFIRRFLHCTCCPAASTAFAITACSPARFERAQHRARPPICARRTKASPERSRADRDETSSLRARVPVAAAG